MPAAATCALLLAIALAGCSDKKSAPGKVESESPTDREPARQSKPTAPLMIEEDKLGDHLPFLDQAEIVQGLQGTWLFDSGIHTVPFGWHLDGSEFDWLSVDSNGVPRPREVGKLQVVAPCKIAHVQESNFKTFTNYTNIVVTNEGLYSGSSMGQRRGSDYVVCTSLGIFSGTHDGCTLWQSSRADSLAGTLASCRFERDEGGAEYFYGALAEQKIRVPVFGDIISTWPLDECRARRVSSLAEATEAMSARP